MNTSCQYWDWSWNFGCLKRVKIRPLTRISARLAITIIDSRPIMSPPKNDNTDVVVYISYAHIVAVNHEGRFGNPATSR